MLFIPRPHSDCQRRIYHIKSTNYIQDEKNLYFIYYFISLLLWRDTALIFYCIDVVTRKAWNIAGISLLAPTDSLQSDEALTSDDELIGHWPQPPDISIQSGLTCCDTRPAASRLISSVGRSLLIQERSKRGCKINAIKECWDNSDRGWSEGEGSLPWRKKNVFLRKQPARVGVPRLGRRVLNMRCDDHYHYVMDTLALLCMKPPCSTLAQCTGGGQGQLI